MKTKIAMIVFMAISFVMSAQEKIKTNLGDKSDFTYKQGTVSIGDSGKSVLNVLKTPVENEAHLFLGNPYAETQSGVVSSRLSFAGTGIQHAGFAWVPNLGNSKGDGKLHLAFGGYQNPMKNSIKATFQSNGNVGIGTLTPNSKLDFGSNYSNPSSYPNKITLWSGGQNNYFGFGISSGDLDYFSQGNHRFYTEFNGSPGTEKMVIKGNGNVGIGLSLPKETLTVSKIGVSIGIYDTSPLSKANNRIARRSNSLVIQTDKGGAWNDNVNFVDNGRVGIGTVTPSEKLEVKGNIKVTENIDATGRDKRIYLGGIAGSTFGIAYNKQYSNYGIFYTEGSPDFVSISPNGNSKNGVLNVLGNGNVGIGTKTPGSKLAVNGTIHSKEVKVDLVGWPDYVFEESYTLPTLKEVEDHIKTKGHLENIPSAKEVAKNGVLLGEMNKNLLQKIEELTLYTIQQEKEIEKLKEEQLKTKNQQKQIDELKKLVQKLVK